MSDLHLGPTHDPAALRDLNLFVYKLRSQLEVSRLLVTGDVTNNGTAHQFGLARTSIDNQARLAGPVACGLRSSQAGQGVVPGNHDYGAHRIWNTTCQSDAFVEYFDPAPAVSDPLMLSNGWSLRVLRICSVRQAGTLDQVLARGSCREQIDALDAHLRALGPRPHKEVRALLLHHPPSYRNVVPNGPFELDAGSIARLDDLVRDQHVSVLLSGHTHVPYLANRRVHGRHVLDAVCGSSALRSGNKAAELVGRVVTGTHPEPLSAIVHDLVPGENALEWTATLYERTNGSFRRSTAAIPTKRTATLSLPV